MKGEDIQTSEGKVESAEAASPSLRGRQMNDQAETLGKPVEKPLPVIQEPAGAEDGSDKAVSFPAGDDK